MVVKKLASMSLLATSLLLLWGCAEGPLWRTGHFSPWAREKWQAEEELADTVFERKRKVKMLVDESTAASQSDRAAAADQLVEIVRNDQILLMRLFAVEMLGKVDSPNAIEALKFASRDPDSQVRIAAVRGWQSMPPEVAVSQLQEILGSDTDVDVRLAATKALGNLPGGQSVDALSLALTDSNPAIQYLATESLAKITGQRLGADVSAWQKFVASNYDNASPGRTADQSSSKSSARSSGQSKIR